MKRISVMLLAVLIIALLTIQPARAQEPEPGTAYIISSTRPISSELRLALNDWLALSPPSSAVYYAVTYTRFDGVNYHVSLAGLNLSSPDDPWSITGDEKGNHQAVWLGTVKVFPDNSVMLKTPSEGEFSNIARYKIAMPAVIPLPGPGGGAYVRFPWQPAKAVQYGILGVHDAEFGNTGAWRAVDLISGTDMGSGAANDSVYASVGGTIDYVCDDGQTVTVRLAGGGDYFLYSHMLDNALLEESNSFSAGAVLGTLKHGSFISQGCGGAIQKANHWHLHWGFITSNKTFQAEGCILSSKGPSGIGPEAEWRCGNTTIKVLGYLYHYGNIGINPDDGTVGAHYAEGAGGGPSFWTYLLSGLKNVFDHYVTNNLPEHSSTFEFFVNPIMNGVKIVMRITLILIHGNLNLIPAMVAITIAIGFKLSIYLMQLSGYIFRVFRR
jgi:hypothetical protein